MREYSVLMSVYAKEKPEYLRESIQSILGQTVKTDDFVIVCDGPLTKELDDILAEFGGDVKLLRLPENVGLGRALQEGLPGCAHELVARMDSDDIAFPDRCERQLAVFENRRLDIVSGTLLEFDGDIANIIGTKAVPETHEEILAYSRRRNPFNHPCVMYRKQAVLDAGGYKPLDLFEDYYLWIRMLATGCKAYNIKEPLLYMRAGAGMVKRRGGFAYLKPMFWLQWYMRRTGYSSWGDFIVSVGTRVLVAVVPNSWRRVFYKRFLRQRDAAPDTRA